jgi:hypothetical protein
MMKRNSARSAIIFTSSETPSPSPQKAGSRFQEFCGCDIFRLHVALIVSLSVAEDGAGGGNVSRCAAL